jgi:hypothetical protein
VRLAEDMETASQYGVDPVGGITRAAWTPELSDALNAFLWTAGRGPARGIDGEAHRGALEGGGVRFLP